MGEGKWKQFKKIKGSINRKEIEKNAYRQSEVNKIIMRK